MSFKFASIRYKIHYLSKRFFYDSRTKHDTIFAPATSIDLAKGSPLCVIRVSGNRTEYILHQLTKFNLSRQNDSKNLSHETDRRLLRARQATLTRIFQPNSGELLDMGLVLWFPKPNSYTGEDVVELHLHGSQAIMKSVLDTLGSFPGLRPAEPGEFTRRAVLNGKMSLLQAESLPDLIVSKTDYQRKLALKGLDGATQNKYSVWIDCLKSILAHLEASIDFGEDELIGEEDVVRDCIMKLRQLLFDIDNFIRVSEHCRQVIQTGLKVAILGKPNSGKSTFMNVLCRRDRSIVSDLSGTTRDVVEHTLELGGHAVTLCDTAGLKDINSDLSPPESKTTLLMKHESVEREGIRRALDAAREAHVIIYLVDGAKYSGNEKDKQDIANELADVYRVLGEDIIPKNLYLVINKMDLNNKLTNDELKSLPKFNRELTTQNIITTFISCKSKMNLDKLVNQLTERLEEISCANVEHTLRDDTKENQKQQQKRGSQQLDYVNERHLSLLRSVQRHLQEASELNLATIDEMAQHVRESVDYLSRIVGSVSNDEVIDVIFKDFCIGK